MSHPLFDLAGRVALVSGAAQNMGRNSALALAEVGADLLTADVNTAGAEDTAEQIRRMGRRAIALTCGVSYEEQIKAMFRRLDEEYGRIDVLVNIPGAGYLSHPRIQHPG